MRSPLLTLAATVFAGSAPASDLRSPLTVTARDGVLGTLDVDADPVAITELTALGALTLREVELPRGLALDLELVRVDLARCDFAFCVDGARAGDLVEGLDLSVWMGRVAGEPESEVALSFSHGLCMGWVRSEGRLFHLVQDGARLVWIDDAAYAEAGVRPSTRCETDSLPPSSASAAPAASSCSTQPRSTTLYEAKLAIETDYQLNQRFGGNVTNQAAYLTTLLAWVSYRYEEQIATVLTYPYVGIYTTPADPWTTQDTGGTAAQLLSEFRAAWASNLPNGAHLGTFLSGASPMGGVAFLPGLCTLTNYFSVCGGIDGQVAFPIAQQPGNHDFHIVCHEVGHNFGAKHTHAYCPPLDQCAPPQSFGPCQTAQVCIATGTTMSYCGQCPGSSSNLTTYFHPVSAADMRARVESTCLPFYCADPAVYCMGKVNSLGCTPEITYAGHSTLSGLDDFHIQASQVISQKPGILFWGRGAASTPFQDGIKCVAAPTRRTPQQTSGGTASGDDCSGAYDFFLTHDYAASEGLVAGDVVYAQFWMRDPASPSTTGLSNALSFTLVD